MIVTRAAISFSKFRNYFGLVIVEADAEEKVIKVKAAHQWKRDELPKVAQQISYVFNKVNFDLLYADQFSGEHLLNDLKRLGIPVQIITTQKNLKDPDGIEKVKIMDKTEQVQFMIQMNQEHRILFPKTEHPIIVKLIKQFKNFAEHKTEQGSIDYYAGGESLDDLTKALITVCFGVRKLLISGGDVSHVGGKIEMPQFRWKDHRPSLEEQLLESL